MKKGITLVLIRNLSILFMLAAALGSKAQSYEDLSSDNIIADVTGIKVIDYKGLQPYLQKKEDTLYVINFWATWCKPCVKELPYFERVNKEFKDEPVRVILVSLDFPKQLESKLIPFIEKNNIQSEVIVLNDPDSNNWINKIDESWSGAIPATLFYSGKTRIFHEKTFTYSELVKIINQNLTEL
jgi:thiol-disulfide isomerase/thioredoxin